MLVTWNANTPLGNLTGPAPAPISYEIDGTLATRTGPGLARAIEAVVGLGEGTVAVVNTTEVHVNGRWLLTLSDGEPDRVVTDWFGAHVNELLKTARGDMRTLVKHVLRRIIRYAKRRDLTWIQFRDYCQAIWNATTTNGD